mmetsp:Transcript_1204/g.2664  ORF Transcript_1204/g.2664 Transcript_1204/m.2664 type:complete len:253 (+) Transcript_1204:444-1202(+)
MRRDMQELNLVRLRICRPAGSTPDVAPVVALVHGVLELEVADNGVHALTRRRALGALRHVVLPVRHLDLSEHKKGRASGGGVGVLVIEPELHLHRVRGRRHLLVLVQEVDPVVAADHATAVRRDIATRVLVARDCCGGVGHAVVGPGEAVDGAARLVAAAEADGGAGLDKHDRSTAAGLAVVRQRGRGARCGNEGDARGPCVKSEVLGRGPGECALEHDSAKLAPKHFGAAPHAVVPALVSEAPVLSASVHV